MIQYATERIDLSLYDFIKMPVVVQRLTKAMRSEILYTRVKSGKRPAVGSPEPPTYVPTSSCVKFSFVSKYTAVKIMLNPIRAIEIKYNRIIKSRLDLYQMKNKYANQIKKTAAVP